MTLRRFVWPVLAVITIAALLLLVPASPAYLPRLMMRYGHMYDGHGIGYWRDALDSPDPEMRRQGVFNLGMLGPPAEEAIPDLARIMLNDPDWKMRAQAALALSKMAPASRKALPELSQALGDPEHFVRMNAAVALFRLRGDSRPAVPALIEALQNEENNVIPSSFSLTVQEMVVLALGRASAGTAEAVPALIDVLRTATTDHLRWYVVRALGTIGHLARDAAPQLVELCHTEDSGMREAAERPCATSAPSRPRGNDYPVHPVK